MFERVIKIGFLSYDNSTDYDNIKQISTYYPVEIVHRTIGNYITDSVIVLENNLEKIIRELNNYDHITYFILSLNSNVIVSWALGTNLIENNGYYCDKKERFPTCKFFCANNSLTLNGSLTNLLIVVRNIYRFADVLSGQTLADVIDIYSNRLYESTIPNIQYLIYQQGDNASETVLANCVSAGKSLNMQSISIPVQLIVDPNPVSQAKFGGLFVPIDVVSFTQEITNYVNQLNTTNANILLNLFVNGGYYDAMTNMILNYELVINQIPTTIYAILKDIVNTTTIFGLDTEYTASRNARNRFVNGNYTYYLLVSGDVIPALPLTQYACTYNFRDIWNPIMGNLGFLPTNNKYYIPLINVEIIVYIVYDFNHALDKFTGMQDNRFRFDTTTQRSRICALLSYLHILANTFEEVEIVLIANQNDKPSFLGC